MPPDAQRPPGRPIGLQLALTAKAVSMSFNAALQAHGGSVPVWLILNALTHENLATQLDLARSLGIEGPTLTRHLDNLEEAGLVERRRSDEDRRAVRVALTESGSSAYTTLRSAVAAFNDQLLQGISEDEQAQLRALLERLGANAGEAVPTRPGSPAGT
jgi:MarR family transcriptional regulator for hemolysin